MRKMTFAAIALAATMGAAGLARADEYNTAKNREAAEVAAESAGYAWQGGAQQGAGQTRQQALGYAAPASQRAQQLNTIFPEPRTTAEDRAFIDQGDRGFGANSD